jgi:hypothetical protein
MDKFFNYLNIFPLPLWLAMMIAPKHPLTERAGRSSSIFVIAALNYVVSLLLALRHSREDEDAPPPSFTSLDGVRAGLSHRPGALAAWSHMLALDLFAGAWIYRQARRLNAPGWVRILSLFFAMMAGPIGLAIFLLWRALGTEKGEPLAGVRM